MGAAPVLTQGAAGGKLLTSQSLMGAVMTVEPAPRRRRKEARPGELLDAALTVFSEKGYAAARLDEVAARAGVSKGTIYLYFSGKEELFKAMVRAIVLPNLAGLTDLVDKHQGPASALLAEVLRRLGDLISTHKAGRIPKIVIAEAGTFPELARFWVAEVVERGRALITAILDRGVASGEFSPQGAEAALVVISPLLMLALWNTALGPAVGRSLDGAAVARQAAEIVLNGLRCREESP